MGYYHTAQICHNGHLICNSVDRDFEFSQNFCSKCGAPTIKSCPSCSSPIRGTFNYDCDDLIIIDTPTVPSYCHACGKPFPWTASAIENTALLIREEESLSEQQKITIVESLPDIITETPKTNLAAVRVKKGLANAGQFTADALRQFVIDFGCELAKKLCGM